MPAAGSRRSDPALAARGDLPAHRQRASVAAAGIRGTSRDDRGRLVLGDIITSLDGKEVKTQRDLFNALDERRPGDKVRVGLTRDGRKGVEVEVVLGGREIGRDE